MSLQTIERVDKSYLYSEFKRVGALAVPFLSDDLRLKLLQRVQLCNLAETNFKWVFSRDSFLVNEAEPMFQDLGIKIGFLTENLFGGSIDFKNKPFRFNRLTLLEYLPGAHLLPHIDRGSNFDKLSCSVLLEGQSCFYTYPNAFVDENEKFDFLSVNESDRHLVIARPGDAIFFRQNGVEDLTKVPHEIDDVLIRRTTAVFNAITP